MEYRNLGTSGLRVPVLSFGTGTFGGQGPLFSAWGRSDASEASKVACPTPSYATSTPSRPSRCAAARTAAARASVPSTDR